MLKDNMSVEKHYIGLHVSACRCYKINPVKDCIFILNFHLQIL